MQSDAELLNFSTIYDVILNGEHWETFSELFQDKLLLFCAIGKIKFKILFKETWTLLGLEWTKDEKQVDVYTSEVAH